MTETSPKPLLLIDGSSYLYRAFHALPPLANSRGEPTGAVYGVANMLRKLLADYQPDRIAVVFDAKGKTFRDDLFAQYKAHRPPMPDDLRNQIEPLHAIVAAMGLPLLMVDGVEADDVIGTLATQATVAGLHTVISTGDKDMAQLVDSHVTLINTMSNTTLDVPGVAEKFGVSPAQIIDYLALVGDTSDNIPGIPKVGPKTAAKWLQEYGTLDNLVAHADQVSGKVGESLRENRHQLPLSRQLATIRCDVPLALAPLDLHRQPPDVSALREWYKRMEFKTWLAQLADTAQLVGQEEPGVDVVQQGDIARDAPVAPAIMAEVLEMRRAGCPSAASAWMHMSGQEQLSSHYDTVLTQAQLDSWLARLAQAELFAFDTETTSLDYMQAEIVGVSFAVQPGEAAYVPLAHDYPGAPDQLSRDAVLAQLKPLLEDAARPKLGQNLKYDMSVLANYGITLAGIRYDTMLESYVLNSTGSRHDMDTLALTHLDYKTVHFEDIAGKGARQITFNQIALEQASPYACEDADITLRLHHTFWPRLSAEQGLQKLFDEIEMPLVPVLSRIERNGVLVDAQMLHRQSDELARQILSLQEQAYAVAGQPFNLDSPKQVQMILFDKLGLPVIEKTPTGQPSTGESVLQELAFVHPLPKLILESRTLSKLKSTYTDKLPAQIDARTGRVHTSYHQAVAATGRLSSSNPNLQNIPIRSAEGRRIRQAFIAPPGYKIVAADYSQIELRIMAHLSQDAGLLSAFARGEDIHRATAAEIFGVAVDQVSSDQRRSAKAINFGLIYGMSAFGLARQLDVDRSSAQEYMNRYFARYPGVKIFMDTTRAQTAERGYVETLFGRRLYLPDIKSRNGQRRQYAERAAINAPMQGTAADIIKLAMLRADAMTTPSSDMRMIMQVHDELVFEVAEGALDRAVASIRECMASAAQLAVPLVVDIGIGDNWDEAH
jgi:DNA polymerase-1